MSISTEERREEIISIIQENGKVKVSELSERYGISEVSIRKDLELLEAEGHLSRVHGGAVGLNKLYVNMDLNERYRTNSIAKKKLAELARRFIEDNDTIMMNAGTTLTYVLRAIRNKKNITIVTNSVQNATEAALYSDFNVILLGGELDSKYQFTYGEDAISQLENYHANKCILSVDGISSTAGLTLYYSNEAALVKKMIESSGSVIITADSSKVGKNVFARITDASKTDILITTHTENKTELDLLRNLGVKIYEA
ncbi:MAG: DeoR/GlpR transcriptional regulator [Ruminococcaceae bacterium]|nr:DeoR/GlpR transcriptional regulator [Oscillospiraceae bacterium]